MSRANNISFDRFRFSVPKADVSVLSWIESQANLSSSIRTLIRNRIAECGMTDVTCDAVVQKGKVGRPSNAELAQREVMKEQAAELAEHNETANKAEPAKKMDEQQTVPYVAQPDIQHQMSFPIVDGSQKTSDDDLPDMLSMMNQ